MSLLASGHAGPEHVLLQAGLFRVRHVPPEAKRIPPLLPREARVGERKVLRFSGERRAAVARATRRGRAARPSVSRASSAYPRGTYEAMTPPEAPRPHHHTSWTWPARTGGPGARPSAARPPSAGRPLCGPPRPSRSRPRLLQPLHHFFTPCAIYTQLLLVSPENASIPAAAHIAAVQPRS